VRQQNSGAVEDFILPHSAVYLRIQKWKNYWNRSTFAKVIVKIKVAPFLWPTVYILFRIVIHACYKFCPTLSPSPINHYRPVTIAGKLPTLMRRQSVFDERSTSIIKRLADHRWQPRIHDSLGGRKISELMSRKFCILPWFSFGFR